MTLAILVVMSLSTTISGLIIKNSLLMLIAMAVWVLMGVWAKALSTGVGDIYFALFIFGVFVGGVCGLESAVLRQGGKSGQPVDKNEVPVDELEDQGDYERNVASFRKQRQMLRGGHYVSVGTLRRRKEARNMRSLYPK